MGFYEMMESLNLFTTYNIQATKFMLPELSGLSMPPKGICRFSIYCGTDSFYALQDLHQNRNKESYICQAKSRDHGNLEFGKHRNCPFHVPQGSGLFTIIWIWGVTTNAIGIAQTCRMGWFQTHRVNCLKDRIQGEG